MKLGPKADIYLAHRWDLSLQPFNSVNYIVFDRANFSYKK